ncbi:MAG: SDR family oxidoreductase [Bacteroidota bacterium]
MDLGLKQQRFIVGGATSGFGRAVAEALVVEGASVIAIARNEERLVELAAEHPAQVEILAGDLTQEATLEQLQNQVGDRPLAGILVNAGGPPAMSFLETQLRDWDEAYHKVLRWKVALTKAFLPQMMEQKYGRLVYVESVSVKQPIENLVLSNSLRLGVVGFVKTLSQEVAHLGVNLNILGPGYHATPAMERLFIKKSERQNISIAQARAEFEQQTKVGAMGDPTDFAALAIWLLSPSSRYITGQTISVDGGLVKGTMG